MSVTVTPTMLSGIGVFLPMEADLDASTLGQDGPRAGYPEVQEDTLGRRPALALRASGEQESTTSYAITTRDPGHPSSASVVYRRTVSGVQDAADHGADAPNVLVGAAFPGWAVGVTNQAAVHALTLPDDAQIVVCRQASLPHAVVCYRWSPSTGTYSTSTVRSGLVTTHEPWPALLALADPDGGAEPIMLCAYWVADDDADEAQVEVSYSRDAGATWALWSRAILPDAIVINTGSPHYELGRIRWAPVGAQLSLALHVTSSASVSSEKEHVYLYASADYGVSFTLITQLRGYGFPAMASVGPVAYLMVISAQTSPEAWLYTIASAFVDITPYTPVQLFGVADLGVAAGTPAVFSYVAADLVALPSGQLLSVAVRAVTNGRYGYAALYRPSTGVTTKLNIFGVSTQSMWWNDGLATSTEYPKDICVTWYRGQARIYCVMASTTGTYDDRLTRLDLGGISTVTLPDLLTTTPFYPAAWISTMLPTALASVYGATFTGAGTRSISTNAGWETLTTTANQAYYTVNPTAAADEQIWRLWRVKVDTGGGVSGRTIACGIRAAGVGYGFEFEARLQGDKIRGRDVGAATDLTTITIDTSTTGVDVLMAISGAGLVSCWARALSATGGERRTWTVIEEGYQLTDDAGAGGTANVVMWGARATGTTTSRWIQLGATEGSYLQTADLAGGAGDARGIPLAREGAALGDGVTLGALGGPAMAGDAWILRPDADYPIRHTIPVGDDASTRDVIGGQRTSSTEPASGWRATGTSGYVQVCFRERADRVFPALVAVHVEGCTAPSPLIRGYSYSAAAYTTLGTAANTWTGLRFARPSAGSPMVRVDTSGVSTSEPYIRSGALIGSYFRFAASGAVRPIIGNTEGRHSNDGDAALPILTLGGIDGTEPTSGTGGTIIHHRFTFLCAMTATAQYGAFALQWSSAPDTYAGIRANILGVATVEPLLYAAGWGAKLSYEDPAEVIETDSGLRRGRLRMTGPRRSWAVPLSALWSQVPLIAPSVETTRIYKAYSNASYPIAGAQGDEFGKTRGAWLAAYGSRHPLLWLAKFTPGATQTLIGEDAGLYCRVTSPPVYADEYGRATSAGWAPQWKGDVWTFEEER